MPVMRYNRRPHTNLVNKKRFVSTNAYGMYRRKLKYFYKYISYEFITRRCEKYVFRFECSDKSEIDYFIKGPHKLSLEMKLSFSPETENKFNNSAPHVWYKCVVLIN